MRFDRTWKRGTVSWVHERRRLLGAAVVVSALLSLPFALSAPSGFHSEGQVLIPASDVVRTESRQTSAIDIRLKSYLGSPLLRDTRAALGGQGTSLGSVTALQLRDKDLYLITVTATSADSARAGVRAASEALIARSNEIADEQVARLKREALDRIGQLTDRIVRLETQQRRLATLLTSQKAALDRLRLRSPGHAARVAAMRADVGKTAADIAMAQAAHQFMTSRRTSLESVISQADEGSLKRTSVSALVSGPTLAGRSAPVRVLTTVLVAILIGLAVAVLLILLLEQRRGRSDTPSLGQSAPREQVETTSGDRWSQPVPERSIGGRP